MSEHTNIHGIVPVGTSGRVWRIVTCPNGCGRILTTVLGKPFCHGCDKPQTLQEQLELMERRVLGR